MLNTKCHVIITIITGVVIFLGLSWQGWLDVTGFTSPDEEINYHAGRAFAEQGNFFIMPALPEDTDGAFKPRNVQVRDGQLVPLSFLGFPTILGLVTSLTTERAMLFVTPLLATLGLLAFYWIVTHVWGRAVGIISSLLLLLYPGFIFFSVKGLWHNVPFVSFLIFALLFAVLFLQKKKTILLLISSLFLGLALSIRTSEILWVLGLAVVLFIINRNKFKLVQIVGFVAILVLAITPVLIMNQNTFGGPLSFGYTAALERSGGIDQSSSLFSRASNLVIPTEVNLNYYLTHIRWYGIELTPQYFILAIIGIFFVILAAKAKAQKQWLLLATLIFLWLIWFYAGTPYYGGKTTTLGPILGSSFVRYFLPITVAMAPVAAYGLWKVVGYIRPQRLKLIFLTLTLVTVGALSINLVLNDAEGGLVKYYTKDIPQIKNAQQEVVALTDESSIIIAGAKDKLFFPERIVMGYNQLGERQRTIIPILLKNYSVYYNNISGRESDALSVIANDNGFELEEIGNIGRDPLFKFVKESE